MSRVRGRNLLIGFLLIFVASLVLPLILSFWVKHEIEHRMKVRIGGKFSPVLFQSSFGLQDVRLQWEEKVNLISGYLKVDYDLLSFLRSNSLRVKLSSDNLEAELLGDWAKIEGVSHVKFQRFFADLGIRPEGLKEIHTLDAESPMLQLHFGSAAPSLPVTSAVKDQAV